MAPPVKTPADSAVETRYLVMPGHANPSGTAFGGAIMSWIDMIAAMAAQNIQNYTASLAPSLKSAIDEPMEPVTVTVSLQFDSASAASWFFRGRTLIGQAVLPAEY